MCKCIVLYIIVPTCNNHIKLSHANTNRVPVYNGIYMDKP